MITRLFLFLFILCFSSIAKAENNRPNKISYNLTQDPIDVVIAAHPKDTETLDACIDGIRENCKKVKRVIVISADRLTDKAEWFDEKKFPFSMDDVALSVGKGDRTTSDEFFRNHNRGPGWYLQQLLKFYSPFIIPGISSNVLVVDADAIFMNRVEFLNDSNGGLLCISHLEPKERYLKHAERFLPGYKRIYPEIYSVCHHMLFQRAILEDLMRTVEQYHGTAFWHAFCHCVDLNEKSGASEYEIYYNFSLTHTDQVGLRELKWKNSSKLNSVEKYKKEGYHFVAFHTYMRRKKA
jgi:Family of unknown function (DUF6492)